MNAQTNDRNNQANNAGISSPHPSEAPATGRHFFIARRGVFVRRGFVPVAVPADLPAGVEVWRDLDSAVAVGFSGKRSKPDFHYRFTGGEVHLQRFVGEFFDRLRAAEQRKAEQRAKRKAQAAAGHGCNVGDVFVCSWGYEQTNVDYYEIVALHGCTQATVRRIGCQAETTGYLQGSSVPAPGQFLAKYEPMRVKLNPGEPANFRAYSFASAYKMQPAEVAGVRVFRTHQWSAYA